MSRRIRNAVNADTASGTSDTIHPQMHSDCSADRLRGKQTQTKIRMKVAFR